MFYRVKFDISYPGLPDIITTELNYKTYEYACERYEMFSEFLDNEVKSGVIKDYSISFNFVEGTNDDMALQRPC